MTLSASKLCGEIALWNIIIEPHFNLTNIKTILHTFSGPIVMPNFDEYVDAIDTAVARP
jgi:hypothetical protein